VQGIAQFRGVVVSACKLRCVKWAQRLLRGGEDGARNGEEDGCIEQRAAAGRAVPSAI
jgi:hypothetical protein